MPDRAASSCAARLAVAQPKRQSEECGRIGDSIYPYDLDPDHITVNAGETVRFVFTNEVSCPMKP